MEDPASPLLDNGRVVIATSLKTDLLAWPDQAGLLGLSQTIQYPTSAYRFVKLRSELTDPYPQNADVHDAQIQTPGRQ